MTTCDRINIIWNCIPSFYINIIVIKKIGLLVSAYIKVTKIITLYYSELIFMWAYVCTEVVLFMTLNVIMLSIQTMKKHNLLWLMTSMRDQKNIDTTYISVLKFFTKAFDIISETKQNIILNILPLLSFFSITSQKLKINFFRYKPMSFLLWFDVKAPRFYSTQ